MHRSHLKDLVQNLLFKKLFCGLKYNIVVLQCEYKKNYLGKPETVSGLKLGYRKKELFAHNFNDMNGRLRRSLFP